jgi:hypothetical protein
MSDGAAVGEPPVNKPDKREAPPVLVRRAMQVTRSNKI